LLWFACTLDNPIKTGSYLLNCNLQTVDHDRYYFNDNKDNVTVLVFWATWCTICKKELIAFNHYVANSVDSRLKVAAVCFDPEETVKMNSIFSNLNIDYQLLLDERAVLYNQFGVNAAPLTVILDGKGKVDWIVQGYSEAIMQKLTTRIELLLNEYE